MDFTTFYVLIFSEELMYICYSYDIYKITYLTVFLKEKIF